MRSTLMLGALSVISVQCGFGASAVEPVSLDTGFRQMYNLDFRGAHRTFAAWKVQHPGDPLGSAADAAAYLFAEFERLHILEIDLFTENKSIQDLRKISPDPNNKACFEAELAKSDDISAKILANSPDDRNALFAKVLTDGLRGNYAGLIERRNREALSFLKASRSTAEKLIAMDASYYDAYLAVGIENYFLGLRSAATRWMLRLGGAETNKGKGIENLKVTAEKGRYLAPYACLLLAIAYLRDHDQESARKLLAFLAREFPRNPIYQIEMSRLGG